MSRYYWDPEKARENLAKHGVSFEEAATVDNDPLHRTWPDYRHISDEPRFVLVGRSMEDLLLIVITSEGGPRPRIISAWRATKRERREYEGR
jgi:uncharacterized DUF497 family protein